jgi:predicted branched-subunit amino acid permease
LVSAVVYAGASQFALVSLLAIGASPVSVIGAVAAMNLRHLFYGPALLSRLPRGGRRLPRSLLAFGMTDEVFALASASLTPRHTEPWLLGVQAGAYGSWLAGTISGALLARAGNGRWPGIEAGLTFVLPALFLALLLPLLRRINVVPLGLSAVTALGLSRFIPAHVALLVAMMLGAALAAWCSGARDGK